MAYLTWQFMADFVEGEKRLQEDVVRRGETAESHPFFTEKEKAVARLVDSALDTAGYATPLDAITDQFLKNAAAGILVGLLTETSSSREAWMDNVHKAGLAYLARIEAGEVTVQGAVIDAESGADIGGETYSQLLDSPVFDDAHPDATSPRVFPSLGVPRGWRTW